MKLKSISAILISTGLSVIYSYILNTYTSHPSRVWWHSLTFFSVLFIALTFLYFVKADVKTFTGILLATNIFKFILSLVFILVCFFTLKGVFFNFFLHFIGHYILFTIFETRYLLQLIKTR